MPYQNLIIHSIEKEQHSDEVTIIKSESTIEIVGEPIENFCASLIDAYRNDKRISNTKFKDDSRFKVLYGRYKNGEIGFVEATRELIDQMGIILQNKTAAKGGKFAFIEEDINGNSFFYAFLIRDRKGGQIQYSEENSKYILNSVEYADTNNLAMAARVNHNIFLDISTNSLLNYLSFTYSGTKQSEVSDYFSNWLGAAELHKNSEYAKDLSKAILKIGDFDEEGYAGTATEKLQLVLNYAQSNNDDIINLYALSEYLYGPDNRNLIRETCDAHDYIFTEKFKLISTSKNLFKNISVNVSGIKLQFPRNLLDNDIVKVEEGMVVINDAVLAAKILSDYESQAES
ncbi:nucleoid-associated protein [Flagellimonas beolgyonensis]|uniref:nucleoid-associated protein n=1 Tax=Flagellimonas beolgyonensis TaxID=864064 RepID=UPI000F8E7980|nr:nucleoid-associated protein [Allomuricauda beolgyonensis]